MEKSIEISLLYDFYGELLSEKKREAASLYFNEDLSLSEISEHIGITRQGVSDLIRRSESELYEFEDKLGLYSRFEAINASAEKIRELAQSISDESSGQIKERALEIIAEAKKIESLEA
ncbi:MAG: YlxM family DNA-binding protein [Clostridia bacterium]|nr:YlxM family DNA-binding protein [Clostridia bacterium]